MNIPKKGATVAFTAALLASLIATVAAPLALASTSVTSVGVVPKGGTSSGTATFTFTENSAACFPLGASPAALVVTIAPAAPVVGSVTFSGTPVITAPGSLGATAAAVGSVLTINFAGSDPVNIEQISVSGLKIAASANATAGAITATLTGSQAICALPSTTTASGLLQINILAGTTVINIQNTSCPFEITNVANGGLGEADAPSAGKLVFVTNPESLVVAADNGDVIGAGPLFNQPVTTAVGTANAHGAGETVTQAGVPNCNSSIQSPGTVANVAIENVPAGPTTVNPGENNQPASNVTLAETAAGVIPVGTLTYTLSAAGVLFSASPTVGVVGATQQTLTIAATALAHPAGATVSQAHIVGSINGVCTSTGTLNAPTLIGAVTLVVNLSSAACPFQITGAFDGPVTISGGGTDSAPGLAASAVSVLSFNVGALTAGTVCSLSLDRMSCTVSVSAASTAPSTITLSAIRLDVAVTTPLGTKVNVTITSSAGLNVLISANTTAVVGRVIVGTAAQPTIYIGFNDQSSGQMTLAESGPGFFTAGAGPANAFSLCIENTTVLGSGEKFTRAPWAVVTIGDLKLLSGVVGVTQIKGTLFIDTDAESCAYWTVYSASTVASTIEIRGSADDATPLPSGPTNGPRLSVPNNLNPGSTQSEIAVGTLAQVQTDGGALSLVSNAIRAFKNSVAVVAASAPVIRPGSQNGLAGNIVITETQNGQLKLGDTIVMQILPRATVARQDVILEPGNTNDLPLIGTNAASGLLVTPVAVFCPATALLGIVFCAMTTTITQQSFGPALGQITISNIHLVTTADAVLGPVNVRVTNTGILGFGIPTGQPFDTVVSNATIGNAPAATAITNGSAIGVTTSGPFSASTKVVALNKYVTFQATTNLPVGTHLEIWVAVKTGSTWSAFSHVTTRLVGVGNKTYYNWRSATAKWVSVQWRFAGDSAFAASASTSRQARAL